MTLFLDTQQIHSDLAKKGGFNEIQADALTDVLRILATAQGENLATKADLKLLATKDDFDELRAEVSSIRHDLRNEISAVKQQLQTEFANKNDFDIALKNMATKADLQVMQQQLTIRFGGLIALGIGLLATIQQVLG